jgi:glycosyltransferase involved in cell wall biosynthesis
VLITSIRARVAPSLQNRCGRFRGAKTARPDLALVLVGDGRDRGAIEARICALGLENDVVLTGFREDVPALLSAFDCFALPSRFEGRGIVLIEAQACGLPCLSSDVVPRDTRITACAYLPNEDAGRWTRALAEIKSAHERAFPERELIERGYDIRTAAHELADFYLEAAK